MNLPHKSYYLDQHHLGLQPAVQGRDLVSYKNIRVICNIKKLQRYITTTEVSVELDPLLPGESTNQHKFHNEQFRQKAIWSEL